MATCLRCDYEWEPRKSEPKKCPRCQNPNWNRETRRAKKVGRTITTVHYTEAANFPEGPEPECMHAPIELDGILANPRTPESEISKPIYTPIEKDSLSHAKARAEELMKQLTT